MDGKSRWTSWTERISFFDFKAIWIKEASKEPEVKDKDARRGEGILEKIRPKKEKSRKKKKKLGYCSSILARLNANRGVLSDDEKFEIDLEKRLFMERKLHEELMNELKDFDPFDPKQCKNPIHIRGPMPPNPGVMCYPGSIWVKNREDTPDLPSLMDLSPTQNPQLYPLSTDCPSPPCFSISPSPSE